MAGLHVGVIIGRFQVPEPHAGHVKLYEYVRAHADDVCFMIGVSPNDGYTAENPLTYRQRSAAIIRRFDNLTRNGVIVLPVKDCRTNEEWSKQIDDGLLSWFGSDCTFTLFGGRDSFVQSYKGKFTVDRLDLCPPVPVAGTDLRAKLTEENNADFYKGQIYALNRQFPHAYPTVDMAVMRWTPLVTLDVPKHVGFKPEPTHEVLLIQRADSGRWCFPGGFVDPSDQSLEYAAARELSEETGISTASGVADFKYVSSFRVNDFRYRGTRDKIITTLFAVEYSFGPVSPNYTEVQDYKWMTLDAAATVISDIHAPLLTALRAWAPLNRLG